MLRVEQVDGVSIIRVLSDIDISTAPHFEKSLKLLRDEIAIVVDLDACPYLDSSGLSVLYRAVRGQHVIIHMPKNCIIRKIFDIAGSKELFVVFDTEAAAIQAAQVLINIGERLPINPKLLN